MLEQRQLLSVSPLDPPSGGPIAGPLISDVAVATVNGDADSPNENDLFQIIRQAGDNSLVDIYRNGVLFDTYSLGTLQQININGLGGNDTLTVDSTNGLIAIPIGIKYDGGTGFDALRLSQTGGALQTSDTYAPGPVIGTGTSMIVGASGTQSVSFNNLEPVIDTVSAASLTVNGTNENNAINYALGPNSGTDTVDGATSGIVTVDNQESIEFANKTTLIINGLAGSDEINLNNPSTPTGLNGITVAANDPTASDTLVVNGTAAANTITYTPTSATGGTVAVSGSPTITFNTVETLIVNGQGGGDTLVVDSVNVSGTQVLTPGASFDSGRLDFQTNSIGGNFIAPSLNFRGLGNGSLSIVDGPAGSPNDNFIYRGTDLIDTFTVTAASATVGTVRLNSQILVNLTDITQLTLAGLADDDVFVVPGVVPFSGITLDGGEPAASDLLVYTPATATTTTVNLAAGQLTSSAAGSPTVSLIGIETVNALGSNGAVDRFVVNGFGSAAPIKTLNLSGGDTNNNDGDTITVNTTSGPDTITYTPLSNASATITRSTSDPVINVTAFNNANGNLVLANPGSIDSLNVVGSVSSDTISVVQPAANTTRVTVNANLSTKWVPVDYTTLRSLGIAGGLGNDILTVDNTTSLVTLADGVTFDGGDGTDTVQIVGTTAVDTDTYTVGPQPGAGSSILVGAGGTQKVFFTNVEPVIDTVPAATLFVVGTNADNAITYTQSPTLPTRGMVAIDDQETIEFSGKVTLDIEALSGSDTITLNNPTIPLGLSSIVVAGADPTGSDTLIANTVEFSHDKLTLEPAGTGSGILVHSVSHPNVLFNGIEHLTLVGQVPDGDTFGVDGTEGVDSFVYTVGDATDTGTVTGLMNINGTRFPLVPISFRGMSYATPREINLGPQEGSQFDTLLFQATAGDDALSIEQGDFGTVNVGESLGGWSYGSVTTDQMAAITVDAFSGNDSFNYISGSSNPSPPTIKLLGGDSDSSSDTLIYNVFGANVNVDLETSTITSPGSQDVSFAGIEKVALNLNGGLLAVTGTSGEDNITYTPTGPLAGSFQNAGSPTLFTFTDVSGTFTIFGGGDVADRVTVLGTNARDTIKVDAVGGTAQVNFLKTVTVAADVEQFEILARGGDDTIIVTPAEGVPPGNLDNLLIHVDGGEPSASDALVIAQQDGAPLDSDQFVVLSRGRDPNTGTVRVYSNGAHWPDISYAAVEIVSPLVSGGPNSPNLLVLGPDNYEPNEFLATAAFLGAGANLQITNASIFPNDTEHPFVPADQDYYRIIAAATGYLDVQLFFQTYSDSFVPGSGILVADILDENGELIGSSFAVPAGERAIFPAVAGETYYLHVHGLNGIVVNGYNATIANVGVPVPQEVNLDPADDTGISLLDQVTFNTADVHFFVHADLANFAAHNIPILTAAEAAGGDTAGAAVEVFVNGISVGFADAVPSANNTIFDILLNADLVNFSTGGPNAAGPLGYNGFTNFVTAAVRIFDGKKDVEVGNDPATDRGLMSPPELVIFDDTAPLAPSTPDLLSTSDSGASAFDDNTSVNPPAFKGFGEANAIVRVVANGEIVGEARVGSDATFGAPDDGLGAWEVTVEPLADGQYIINAFLEDLAGNVGPQNEAGLFIIIDTLAPQRPTIDLVDAFDTGWSDKDNVTKLTTLDFRVSADPGSFVVIKDGNTVVFGPFVMPAVAFVTVTISWPVAGIAAEGPHPLSAESADDAGNRSAQSEELLVTIDSIGPAAPTTPALLPASDSGTFNSDGVTRLQALAVRGTGEANTRVTIFANGLEVGQGVVGTDGTAPPEQLPGSPPAIGAWEVTTEPLADGTYSVTATLEDQAGNISTVTLGTSITVDSQAPNAPSLVLTAASDTGRNDTDLVTRTSLITMTITADDVFGVGNTNPFPHDIRYRIFDRTVDAPGPPASNDRLLVDSFTKTGSLLTGRAFSETLDLLSEGIHELKAEIEDRAGNVSQAFFLRVIVDKTPPPVRFGFAGPPTTSGLDPGSDSGVSGDPPSFTDRITNVTRPKFFGTAEANTIVRLFVDINGNGTFNPGIDPQIGQTVATPPDGNSANPLGQWNITATLNLNDPAVFPLDGLRTLFVTAEDLAGNTNIISGEGNDDSLERLQIFLDTQGPRISDVFVTDHEGFNLFGLKPDNVPQGPTPLVTSLTIRLFDLPNEVAEFLRNAIEAGIAATPGLITVKGDHTGFAAIDSITVTNDSPIAGAAATASIVLHFSIPLPDDRFTLTVSDTIPDIAGNRLDGETRATEPAAFGLFPSGDGQPGGTFVARFTVDSRPEIGTYAAANVFVDANGNFVSDPQNNDNDTTNDDLTFTLGIVPALQGVVSPMGIHDTVFAGNFPQQVRDEEIESLQWIGFVANGFDKLAAYGNDPVAGGFRWLIDTDCDGIIDPAAGDHATKQAAGWQINALPVAGDFDGNPTNGDEIGLFDGTRWYFDTNHNWVIDSGDLSLATNLRGLPIVGDFNGDGTIDLATWRDDVFYFNFGTRPGGAGTPPTWNGQVQATINWGLPGNAEMPVAADMDKDGITDIGLFIPSRAGTLPTNSGNWEFLVSHDFDEALRGGNQVTALNHPFSPDPLGHDLFAQFGDNFALPIVGNFDPPIASPALAVPTPLSPLLGTLPLGQQTVSGERWYSFTPLRNGVLSVSVASSWGDPISAALYDTSYALMVASAATPLVQSSVGHPVTAGQSYLLRLSGTSAIADVKLSNQLSDSERLDVSRNGLISPQDALQVINELNAVGMHSTPLELGNRKLYFDTNLDGMISPADVVQVINYLIHHPLTAVPSAAPAVATSATAGASTLPVDDSAATASGAIGIGVTLAAAGGTSGNATVAAAPADQVDAEAATATIAAKPQVAIVESSDRVTTPEATDLALADDGDWLALD